MTASSVGDEMTIRSSSSETWNSLAPFDSAEWTREAATKRLAISLSMSSKLKPLGLDSVGQLPDNSWALKDRYDPSLRTLREVYKSARLLEEGWRGVRD